MERARDLSRRALGEAHPKTLEAMRDLGELYMLQGNHSQAEPMLTRSLELSRRVRGEEHPDTLVAMNDLGRLYTVQRKYAQAEPVLSKGLEVSRRVLGEYHPTTLEAMNNLAALSLRQRNYDRAEALFNRILAVCVRVWGEDHPDTLSTRANLGVLNLNQGKYGQAELELTRSLEVSRRVLGEGHPNTLEIMTGLIVSYRMQGKDTQAESLLARAAGIYERQGNSAGAEAVRATDRANRPRAVREAFTTTGPTIDNRSVAGQFPGNLTVRDPLLPPLLEPRRNVNNQALAKANSAWTQASAQLEQHNYAAAERLLREAAEYFDRSPDDWARYRNQSLLGESLAGQGKFAEAEPLLLAAYQGMTELQDTRRVYPLGAVEKARDRIVQLYLSWGKPEKASAWKAGAAK
jgi:tetratricopeptide (TPR) repeat protein